jgi:hypothetical protein
MPSKYNLVARMIYSIRVWAGKGKICSRDNRSNGEKSSNYRKLVYEYGQ